ncbi:hypothetical protein ASD78_14890 [Lysobacter sp. Root667]|uniref:hypothetical protein n=1 Tax=Lysobacter sp. Root667 TaxID=1736581 RepID=UPI0006FDA271|nr:hypothetical protein [Lysobacter sp. Root667]KRA72899.1 hypothetical protein ASD78_14890 [Lysobacter sp. Root667]
MAVTGAVTFTLKSGKVCGPYSATREVADNYVDVVKGGKDYPTKLDFNKFHTVASITFKPGVGGATSWTSWDYFNNGQWTVDRFTNLA